MFQGRLLEIYITARRRGEPQRVDEVEAIAGHGLRGDRFYHEAGMGSPRHEVTLIENEALAYLAREQGIALGPGQSRRNLVTEGVPLNDLVKRKFTIGTVILRGILLCEPCRHLEKITSLSGITAALRGRGGLRAEVLRSGTLRTGDRIHPLCDSAETLIA
jgi:MOSC domain-containing protein YiiM